MTMQTGTRTLALILMATTLGTVGCAGAARTSLRTAADEAPPVVRDLEPWRGGVRVAMSDAAALVRQDDAYGLVASVVSSLIEPVGMDVAVRCLRLRRASGRSSVVHAEVEVAFPSGGKEAQRTEVVDRLASLEPNAEAFEMPDDESSDLIAAAD
jgi:hypothetical protein